MKLATLKAAELSECGRYRYTLSREWVRTPHLGRCAFVMLNPSTADGLDDDNTIRRCVGFAHGWGFTALDVVNLYAWRSTYPKELLRATDPVGPLNDAHIATVVSRAARVVLAWGANVYLFPTRARPMQVTDLVRRSMPSGCEFGHLGLTKSTREPQHPLRLPKTQIFGHVARERGVPIEGTWQEQLT